MVAMNRELIKESEEQAVRAIDSAIGEHIDTIIGGSGPVDALGGIAGDGGSERKQGGILGQKRPREPESLDGELMAAAAKKAAKQIATASGTAGASKPVGDAAAAAAKPPKDQPPRKRVALTTPGSAAPRRRRASRPRRGTSDSGAARIRCSSACLCDCTRTRASSGARRRPGCDCHGLWEEAHCANDFGPGRRGVDLALRRDTFRRAAGGDTRRSHSWPCSRCR
jgi:hypothetical protein